MTKTFKFISWQSLNNSNSTSSNKSHIFGHTTKFPKTANFKSISMNSTMKSMSKVTLTLTICYRPSIRLMATLKLSVKSKIFKEFSNTTPTTKSSFAFISSILSWKKQQILLEIKKSKLSRMNSNPLKELFTEKSSTKIKSILSQMLRESLTRTSLKLISQDLCSRHFWYQKMIEKENKIL